MLTLCVASMAIGTHFEVIALCPISIMNGRITEFWLWSPMNCRAERLNAH